MGGKSRADANELPSREDQRSQEEQQLTHRDRRLPFMEGVDPSDPLAFRP